MLLSSHMLDQVQRVCNRVALFQSGRIVLMGAVADLARKVLGAGFVVEVAESIVHHVFPSFRRWMLRNAYQLVRYDKFYAVASAPYLVYPWDYARIVARKPA